MLWKEKLGYQMSSKGSTKEVKTIDQDENVQKKTNLRTHNNVNLEELF